MAGSCPARGCAAIVPGAQRDGPGSRPARGWVACIPRTRGTVRLVAFSEGQGCAAVPKTRWVRVSVPRMRAGAPRGCRMQLSTHRCAAGSPALFSLRDHGSRSGYGGKPQGDPRFCANTPTRQAHTRGKEWLPFEKRAAWRCFSLVGRCSSLLCARPCARFCVMGLRPRVGPAARGTRGSHSRNAL